MGCAKWVSGCNECAIECSHHCSGEKAPQIRQLDVELMVAMIDDDYGGCCVDAMIDGSPGLAGKQPLPLSLLIGGHQEMVGVIHWIFIRH